MITINRSLVLASTLAVAALVAFAASGLRAAHSPVIDQVAQRFPLASEMFTPVPLSTYIAPKFIAAQKAAVARTPRPAPTRVQSCAITPNGWPYVSHECRVG